MKNLILVFFASLFFVSCKTNSVMYNNKEVIKYSSSKQPYTMDMVRKNQDADAKFINENFSEEEKKWFAEKFFYKDISFSNDTLIVTPK